jgi:hypothetical protein
MRHAPAILALGLCALIAGTGCGRRPEPPPPSHPGAPQSATNLDHMINANSFFGGVNVTTLTNDCAGRIRLVQGAAIVNDACFTGDTNVVLCTDASSANPIQCTASNGKLALAGNGSDLINYARVR